MSTEPRVCVQCPTRLSRYNPDDLCAPCTEKHQDAFEEVVTSVVDVELPVGTFSAVQPRFSHPKTRWQPCAVCADLNGPIYRTPSSRARTPRRLSGKRFGIDGVLCWKCYGQLSYRQKAKSNGRKRIDDDSPIVVRDRKRYFAVFECGGTIEIETWVSESEMTERDRKIVRDMLNLFGPCMAPAPKGKGREAHA